MNNTSSNSHPTTRRIFATTVSRADGPRKLRLICICSAAIVLGTAALCGRTGTKSAIGMGILLLAGGTSGLAYQAFLIQRRRIAERLKSEKLAKRAIVRAERRIRSQGRRMQEIAERDRAAVGELRRREMRAQYRRQQISEEILEAEAKAVREAHLNEIVLILQSQSHCELAGSVAAAYSKIGWLVSIPNIEAPFDLILNRSGEYGEPVLNVSRCVPPDKTADPTDLLALDGWRDHERASHAFLVSVHGFEESVVRDIRLRRMEITLVDAHLLALWGEKIE